MAYQIREAGPGDVDAIVRVYNSNPRFLAHHLGRDCVDRGFIQGELEAMRAAHFRSCVIVEGHSREIAGVLDYRPGETVYLSLMMLDRRMQGGGAGRLLYELFEKEMLRLECRAVRIDVVDTYRGNASGFWKKMGFEAGERTTLNWGGRESSAVVMRKALRAVP